MEVTFTVSTTPYVTNDVATVSSDKNSDHADVVKDVKKFVLLSLFESKCMKSCVYFFYIILNSEIYNTLA